jgi:saccharopine dehydrogenase (NAD+, L-lysine-forming)
VTAHLWIRAETRPTEQRAPLVPDDCRRLVEQGVHITVERSPRRCFSDDEYAAAGCTLVEPNTWPEAPAEAHVVGIKELPEDPPDLVHSHIFFAHAFKGQQGGEEVLARFERGGGQLLDVEYLTVEGRRVVAFGRWAGYVGAALGVLALRDALLRPLGPMTRPDLDAAVAKAGGAGEPVRALVVGARGRSGRGALEALEVAGAEVTRWETKDTRVLDHDTLLEHDLLVNCVASTGPVSDYFVRPQDLTRARRLRVVADVTCDVTSAANRIPVNTAVTTWDQPVRRVADAPPLDVIAIDNLPSLLPRESSESFSAELAPLVLHLADREGPWAAAAAAFEAARQRRQA